MRITIAMTLAVLTIDIRRTLPHNGNFRSVDAGARLMMMTQIRGCSNAKAKKELGWSPVYPSWRVGFVDGLE
ncbi:MAG TPA: hypothetical protein VFK26_06840 [Gemmatimonadaceae bacterium]|jgi:hypothetical protein|nr:hypothetical protein [Gemmatimonadaceae bacterium]